MSFFSSQGFSGLGVGYREVGTRERGDLPPRNISTHGDLDPAGGSRGEEGPWSRMGFCPVWH